MGPGADAQLGQSSGRMQGREAVSVWHQQAGASFDLLLGWFGQKSKAMADS